jgi:NADPH-dependent curcumin reductase CurA
LILAGITRKRLTFICVGTGFLCSPWLSGAKGNFHKDMPQWVAEGKLHIEETTFDGLESWPAAFAALFTGSNTGKVVVRL